MFCASVNYESSNSSWSSESELLTSSLLSLFGLAAYPPVFMLNPIMLCTTECRDTHARQPSRSELRSHRGRDGIAGKFGGKMLFRTAIIVVFAATSIAHAWSGEGHQIVAIIASKHLAPAAAERTRELLLRTELRELIGEDLDLTDAAVNWAD